VECLLIESNLAKKRQEGNALNKDARIREFKNATHNLGSFVHFDEKQKQPVLHVGSYVLVATTNVPPVGIAVKPGLIL
jgi:hypothetical protein